MLFRKNVGLMQQEQIYNAAIELSKSRRAIDIKRALDLFESIPDYKNAGSHAKACQERLDQLAWRDAVSSPVRQKKPMISILSAVACLLVLCVVVGLIASAVFGNDTTRTVAKTGNSTKVVLVGKASFEPVTVPQETAFPTNSFPPAQNNIYETTARPTTQTETPTSTIVPTSMPTHTQTPSVVNPIASNVGVGSIVQYGSYEQDNVLSNGAEPIEWIVLDKQGNKVLLLSRCGLDAIPFHKRLTSVTWAECSLRDWLNTTFFNTAFDES